MKATLGRLKLLPFAALLFISVPGRSAEQKLARHDPVSIDLVPRTVKLWGSPASKQSLVLGKYVDGLERDVSSTAHFSPSQAGKGEVDSSGKFLARGSGDVVLTSQVGDRSAREAIHTGAAEQPHPFTFARDIDRILTRRGCNDSSCHGGVKGRGGFKLAVYGIYPREDYKWIVEGGTFRVLTTDTDPKHPRISPKEPEKSLLLLKPTFSVPHGGGLRFQVGSADYQTILNWIRAGAPYGDEAEKQGVIVNRVEVSPKEVVLEPEGRH